MAGYAENHQILAVRPAIFRPFWNPATKWPPAILPAIFGSGPVSHSVAGQPSRNTRKQLRTSHVKYSIAVQGTSMLCPQAYVARENTKHICKDFRRDTRPFCIVSRESCGIAEALRLSQGVSIMYLSNASVPRAHKRLWKSFEHNWFHATHLSFLGNIGPRLRGGT